MKARRGQATREKGTITNTILYHDFPYTQPFSGFPSAIERRGNMEKRIIEKLRPYQSFGSAAEMHRAVEVHIRNNRLNESSLRVLRVLGFRSKSAPGASWLKYATMAGVIGKCVSTVRRAIRSLVDGGIIAKVAQARARMGGDGANIYVIKPIDHASE